MTTKLRPPSADMKPETNSNCCHTHDEMEFDNV
jgi:hypothetical protein